MTDELRSTFLELARRQPAAEALLAPDRPPLRFADLPHVIDSARQALEAKVPDYRELDELFA